MRRGIGFYGEAQAAVKRRADPLTYSTASVPVGARKKSPPERAGTSFGLALGEGRGRRCRGQRHIGLCGNFVEGGDEFVEFARESFEAVATVATLNHGLGLLQRAADFIPLGVTGLGEHEFK